MIDDFLSVADFDYLIAAHQIATFPIQPRHNSKLLIYDKDKKITTNTFINLSDFLPENSLLVFNDTKTIPARLLFYDAGHLIEIFCLSPYEENNFNAVLQKTLSVRLNVYIGNAKKWRSTFLKQTHEHHAKTLEIMVKRIETKPNAETFAVEISWNLSELNFQNILEKIGILPIPPYLKRHTEESDKINYQTIFGNKIGSVATPTAGLHFTESVFEKLKNKNMQCSFLTLHVGADTFKPIKEKNIYKHQMHGEVVTLTLFFLEQLIADKKFICAVGTTSLRSLESIYWIGVKLFSEPTFNLKDFFLIAQKDILDNANSPLNFKQSIEIIIATMKKNQIAEINFCTTIMIFPDYKTRSIDGIITNFHQPQSTLLLIIKSVVGDAWKDIYNYALKNDFRFFSFGDACLLFNESEQQSDKY